MGQSARKRHYVEADTVPLIDVEYVFSDTSKHRPLPRCPLPRNRDLKDTQPIPHWPRPGDAIWRLENPALVVLISEYVAAIDSHVVPEHT